MNVKTIRKIAQICVAFSEKLNFTVGRKCRVSKIMTVGLKGKHYNDNYC